MYNHLNNILNSPKLEQNFYIRDVLEVAKELLGKFFIHKMGQLIFAGKIVEVEAYDTDDEASHSFNGISDRNRVMFENGGLLYVYFIYGVHYCCNVVTGKDDHGAAVLIRAIEPLNHLELLAKKRFNKITMNEKEKINLTNGPAKICQALQIGKSDNGTSLIADDIYILDTPKIKEDQIIKTTRIGISRSKELPWRFYIKDNKFVSQK